MWVVVDTKTNRDVSEPISNFYLAQIARDSREKASGTATQLDLFGKVKQRHLTPVRPPLNTPYGAP